MLPNTLPDNLLTPADYRLYWENIAFSHKDIGHTDQVKRFFTHPEHITGTGIKYPLICVYGLPLDYRGDRDALFECYAFEVWILQSLKARDAKLIDVLVNECKAIADEIVGKLEEDSKPKGGDWPFKYFQFNDMESSPIDDPIGSDQQVGWSMKVVMGNQKRFIYNPDKWL